MNQEPRYITEETRQQIDDMLREVDAASVAMARLAYTAEDNIQDLGTLQRVAGPMSELIERHCTQISELIDTLPTAQDLTTGARRQD